jgi:hypothetical protein
MDYKNNVKKNLIFQAINEGWSVKKIDVDKYELKRKKNNNKQKKIKKNIV